MNLPPIGIIVLLGVILMPLYVTIAAWLFADPREYRTAGIGIAYILVIVAAMITATALMGVGFLFLDNLPL